MFDDDNNACSHIVGMINCNTCNAYTGSLTNPHADNHLNNTQTRAKVRAAKVLASVKRGQSETKHDPVQIVNMELRSKSPLDLELDLYQREISEQKILYCDVDLTDTHENNILDIWVDTYFEYFILSLFDFNDWQ